MWETISLVLFFAGCTWLILEIAKSANDITEIIKARRKAKLHTHCTVTTKPETPDLRQCIDEGHRYKFEGLSCSQEHTFGVWLVPKRILTKVYTCSKCGYKKYIEGTPAEIKAYDKLTKYKE